MAKLRIAALWALVWLVLFLGVKFAQGAEHLVLLRDPDAFIHLRLAALTDEQGVIDRIPQAEDIAWSESFADKEFLFHRILAIGHALGGMEGAVHAHYAIISLFYLTLLIALVRLGGWPALAFGLVALVAVPYLHSRVFMLRPQTLAMTMFLWILLAAMAGRHRWTFLCSVLFALAYHALYVPLIAVAAASGVAWILREKRWGMPLAAGVSGLMLGALVNPYFPGNLEIGMVALRIMLHLIPTMELAGTESRPPGLWPLFIAFGAIATLFLACAVPLCVSAVRNGLPRIELARPRLTLLAVGLVTMVMLIVNPRSGEYFIPTALLLAGLSFPLLVRGSPWWLAVFLLPVAASSFRALPGYVSQQPPNDAAQEVERALREIPVHREGAEEPAPKVLGCTWPIGGYVFFFRPDLRVADMLDPTFLYLAHPEKFRAREKLREQIVDRYGLIQEHFDADYVLCSWKTRAALNMNPAFERLYPPRLVRGKRVHLFRVSDTRPREQVLAFSFRVVAGDERPETSSGAVPGSPETIDSALFKLESSTLAPGECVVIEPAQGEIRRLAGGSLLGIGGMAAVTLRLNGRILSRATLKKGFTLARFVELPEPLLASDRLSATACPIRGSDIGFWLSIWTREGYAERCERSEPIPRYCGIQRVSPDAH